MKIDTLGKLVRAVCAAFPQDTSRPSVTLSYLKDGKFYGSILRYSGAYAAEKRVVYKTSADTIDGVLKELAEMLLGDKDAMDQLRAALKVEEKEGK